MICKQCHYDSLADYVPPSPEELHRLQVIVHSPTPYRWVPVFWWEVLAEKRGKDR